MQTLSSKAMQRPSEVESIAVPEPLPHELANPPLEADQTIVKRSFGNSYLGQFLRTVFPLAVADVFAIGLGVGIAIGLAALWTVRPVNHAFAFLTATCAVQVFVFTITHLYPAAGLHPAVELRQLTLTWFGLGIVSATFALYHGGPESPYVYLSLGTFLIAMVASPILRTIARGIVQRYGWWGYPAIMIGEGALADKVDAILAQGGGRGLRLMGRFDHTHRYWQEPHDSRVDWLGSLEDVIAYARENGIQWLIVAMPDRVDEQMIAWIQFFRQRFRHVVLIQTRHELPSLWNRPLDCGGLSAMMVEERLLMPEQQLFKRLLDLAIIAAAAIFLIPLIGLLTLLVFATSGRPVFYKNLRIGRDGRRFGTWKFRTMVPNADHVLQDYLDAHPEAAVEFEATHKLKNDPRITTLGALLRKTSLDELPQVWNVVRGEMSLVGPRPIQPAEIAKYGETYTHYLRVRPGITGMWQISGRNNTTYDERLRHDRFYVRNWSLWLDLYILGRTLKTVLRCEGAY